MSRRRVAIVTGASSGIGWALTERAVRAGWNVFAVGRRGERLDELTHLLEGATGKLAILALDLRSPGAASEIVSAALERFGRLDVLVNNAGGVAVGKIAEQSDEALREQMETHVIVPLALTREALPALRASKGQVFYVGSGVARIPVGSLGAYPPAKAAVRNMVRVARNELRHDGIAVTYVDPGAVATEFMTRAGFSGPPQGIAASPYDVARKIFAAFETRQAVVNAVPWQTFFVAIGEALPSLTDFVLQRAPGIVGVEVLPAVPAPKVLPPVVEEAHIAAEFPPALQTPPADEPVANVPVANVVEVPVSDVVEVPVADVPAAVGVDVSEGEYLPPDNDEVAHLGRSGESAFELALAPLEGRMHKMNLTNEVIARLLVVGNELQPADVALGWAGMPNKHERALTHQVLDALADSGFLERIADERYRVLRGLS